MDILKLTRKNGKEFIGISLSIIDVLLSILEKIPAIISICILFLVGFLVIPSIWKRTVGTKPVLYRLAITFLPGFNTIVINVLLSL